MSDRSVLESIEMAEVLQIALKAGRAVMEIYEKDFTVEYKEDSSPLTEADQKAHEIITEGLQNLRTPNSELRTPDLPILSEEGRDIPYEERREWEYYWCIDPIDGTKEFIKKNGEFTINIALIHKETPVLGVVYAPALGEIYWAKKEEGAWKAPVDSRWSIVEGKEKRLPLSANLEPRTPNTLKIVASKSHLNEDTKRFIEDLAKRPEFRTLNTELVSKGSSLKLCMVAEGSADIYPRLAPTMEWDTAAADAIVRESGRMVYQYDRRAKTSDQRPLLYNKKDLLNPWFVVN